jgi:hypothetical protein
MKPNEVGSAFPHPEVARVQDGRCVVSHADIGMSLRDWFAGKEQLSGYDDWPTEMFEPLAGKRPDGNWATNTIAWLEWEAVWRARIKYIRADAMLKAREARR